MNNDMDILSNLARMTGIGSWPANFQNIAEQNKEFITTLRRFHPVKSAIAFGSLLTQKELQPNCLRLEILVHLCIAYGNGSCTVTTSLLRDGFNVIGNTYGHLEDPPEDIFVGNIYSRRGNYRVLEGLWESATFYLQRLINMVDDLPEEEPFFQHISNSVHALLKLSDIVCERANLKRNDYEDNKKSSALSGHMARKHHELSSLLTFTIEQLESSGINIDNLSPFIYRPEQRNKILTQEFSHTDVERQPLVWHENKIFLILPTAVTLTVRRFIIESLGTGQNRNIFIDHLSREYFKEFAQTPLLGEHCDPLPFVKKEWGTISFMTTEVDSGRFANFVFFLDTLEDFATNGFSGPYTGNEQFENEIIHTIESLEAHAEKKKGFRDGITLIIGCGVGRGSNFGLPSGKNPRWKREMLSAPDLCTLSWTKEMEPLHLWRIFEMKNTLKKNNVFLRNMNGLLNLFAWANSQDGHLIPHADIPPDSLGKVMNLVIPQNGLAELRHDVVTTYDCHAEQFIDGTWKVVRTEGRSAFEEDKEQPVYCCIDSLRGGNITGACITPQRVWWFELASPDETLNTISYGRWEMVRTWASKAVSHLDESFGEALGKNAILWRCVFMEPQNETLFTVPGTEQDAINAIRLTVDKEHHLVEFRIFPDFDKALFNQENIAEKTLVSVLISGVAKMAEITNYQHDEILKHIVPNSTARQSHAFAARTFRDHIKRLSDSELVTINMFDDASCKLGLGWMARLPDEGNTVTGKPECLRFLNSLVERLENELCEELKKFNRSLMLNSILNNHESASISRDRWHKTSSAIIGLRKDNETALNTMREHEFKLNAVFVSSRILMEMAICECPTNRGLPPGKLDLSRLMAKAAQIFYLGGWSDLIRWNCMEPRLIIRPYGDVHADHDFVDTVIENFSSVTSEHRFMSSVNNYSKNLNSPEIVLNANDLIEAKFIQAWSDEFGATVDDYRRFIDAIENYGIEQNKLIIKILRSELLTLMDNSDIAARIISDLSFIPRSCWRNLPDGYSSKDIASWRFRRRLSITRLPLLQLSNDSDPYLLIAPGILRESFAYMIDNYYSGSYSDNHLGPAMRKYVGYARERDGINFNKEVAQRMSELGWQTQSEVTLTKITRQGLGRNYGDVDVLAWSPETGRVLVMECKDLQFRKTYGEIAEQLSDFLGEIKDNGKGDYLRKHLDRVEILTHFTAKVKEYLNITQDISIESHLVFRHPVPMQFSNGPIKEMAQLHTFDELDTLK
ncbi:zinc chelation protein SecC [Salmonella enterica subsp. diarizonae]|nr:zinc chelation protein SecC [Salmonella enterica subsp. diarizonae]